MEDEKFREKFLSKISSTSLRAAIKSGLKKREVKVVFAILLEETANHRTEKKIENLPAFSVVNLSKFTREIETLGLDVSIQFVFTPKSKPRSG